MERSFNNEGFEKLLRDNANQYRMYPSEKVWKGVHSALHTRRKWYALSALLLFILTGTGLSLLFINKKEAAQQNISSVAKFTLATVKPGSVTSAFLLKETNPQNDIVTEKRGSGFLSTIVPAIPFSTPFEKISPAPDAFSNSLIVSEKLEYIEKINADLKNRTENIFVESTEIAKENNVGNELASEIENKTNATEYLTAEKNNEQKLIDEVSAVESLSAVIPAKKKQPRVTAQIYFTPTVSYRTLTENKGYYSNGMNLSTQVVNLKSEVKHKPAIGFEFGIEGKYKINDRFYFKTGFQFNINRYDIRAYSHTTEVATVTVSSGYRTDSIRSLSNYRNKDGINANWLENYYFQASVPVGAEIILTQRKKYSLGISGTIQPTYVIGDRAYLISSDYRNYAKFPDLMRRWNISTGLETFIAYSTGKINWQAGPHLRYQHLSSFKSGYPVKENLFAVGFKVAASFNKN